MKRNAKKNAPPAKLACDNCGGGLVDESREDGLVLICPKCKVRVAGPFVDANDIPDYEVCRESWGIPAREER